MNGINEAKKSINFFIDWMSAIDEMKPIPALLLIKWKDNSNSHFVNEENPKNIITVNGYGQDISFPL